MKRSSSLLLVLFLAVAAITLSCNDEQKKANQQFREKLSSLELHMPLSEVEGVLGKSNHGITDQPDTPYVQTWFFKSPDTSIGMAKCYFSKYTRLMKVEWDSVYLDIKDD